MDPVERGIACIEKLPRWFDSFVKGMLILITISFCLMLLVVI
jgi:hypothetical protein